MVDYNHKRTDMKYCLHLILLMSSVITYLSSSSQQSSGSIKSLNNVIDKNFKDADAQYKLMMRLLPANEFPKTFEHDSLKKSNSGWWCSGFYPGSLLRIYEQTHDTVLFN